MLRLNISTKPIRLDYSIQNPQLNLHSNPPKLKMTTNPPKLEIYQPRGELTIDQTPCRYSIGLKNIADFARDNALLGRQTAMEAIGRIVEEGNQMGRIENKSNVLANIAANSSVSEPLDITWAHIDLPDISYEAKSSQFYVTDGKVNFNLERGSVEGDYRPGKVNIRVVQYPKVEISAVDVKV